MSLFNCGFFEMGCDFIPDVINGDANSDITGDWINLENYDRAYLLLIKPAGTAGDDLAIATQQATTAAGAGAKALTFSRLWYKVGTMTAQTVWTAVTLTTASSDLDLDAVNGADLLTDVSASVILTEIMADNLDAAGGFKFINALWVGTDVANALLINAHWILCGGKYPQAVPPSALA